jgi:hypothetical protein
MKLPELLQQAYAAIDRHIDIALGDNRVDAERAKLETLDKQELIEMVLSLKFKSDRGKVCINVEDLAYSILCDPDCAILSYDLIEAAITARKIPGLQTKAGNLRWYASKGIEKARDVCQRGSKQALQKLLAQIAF